MAKEQNGLEFDTEQEKELHFQKRDRRLEEVRQFMKLPQTVKAQELVEFRNSLKHNGNKSSFRKNIMVVHMFIPVEQYGYNQRLVIDAFYNFDHNTGLYHFYEYQVM